MTDHRTTDTTPPGRSAPGIDRGQRGSVLQLPDGAGLRDRADAGLVLGGRHRHWCGSPAVPVLLAALAIGQMGVHVVFFFHISSGPGDTNNFLALAFGVFVVGLVVFGSMLIMANLDANMPPMDKLMKMQR